MLEIPPSNETVRVRMTDTTTRMLVNARSFIQPVQRSHELLNLTDVAFLVEHEASGRRVMFDLGVRKDYWNLPPVLKKRLGTVIPALRVDKDVTEILEEAGIALESISSIIWSHYHWDHTGNVSLFPSSTSLVVGPGFKALPILLPGFPDNPNSVVLADAFRGRELLEIDFESSQPRIAGFRSYDFFGDGSFYLLDTPGHCVGHMCGLARTTPDTFVLLGGDICHFAGDIRPSPGNPLPSSIPAEVLDRDFIPSPCPCSLLADQHPKSVIASAPIANPDKTPFYDLSTHETSSYHDHATAQHSVNQLIALDQSPSVLVCLAHDTELLRHLPTLNDSPSSDLNDWKGKGWKEKLRWGWVNELPRQGRPGRRALVEGFWRDGQPWENAKAELRELGERAGGTGTGL